MGFFFSDGGAYHTDARHILIAARYFKATPNGRMSTGMWTDPQWTAEDFIRWFRSCLNAKINSHLPPAMTTGRKHSEQWQLDCWIDSRTINEYARRIRRYGSGNLRTPEMRQRYPHINIQHTDW